MVRFWFRWTAERAMGMNGVPFVGVTGESVEAGPPYP